MKLKNSNGFDQADASRPARGGWIEIKVIRLSCWLIWCPAPHGAGGLKLLHGRRRGRHRGPAPHGAGGLK